MKTILISIIVVIAIVVGILVAKPGPKEKPAEAPKAEVVPSLPVKEDSTAAINQALEEIETIDLDKEFQTIDADLRNF